MNSMMMVLTFSSSMIFKAVKYFTDDLSLLGRRYTFQ